MRSTLTMFNNLTSHKALILYESSIGMGGTEPVNQTLICLK